MNKGLFKLIFNKRTGQLTPTWEGAPSQGKSGAASRAAALLLTLMMFAEPVLANPSGATVVNGSVGFNQSGNTLTITNSPNAIINWQSFSINKDEITRFIQQNGASAVLNRVTGQDPSKILGTLQSNGRVFIINPNGIVFGQGSVVDVAGLVASTLKMSDSDFLNGKYNFSNGENAGAIQNQGSITTATGGQVYLIAPNIENSGVITSPKGEIILAAGHTVSLVDPKNPDIVVSLTAPATSAVNVGQMIAEGGGIGIFAGLIKQSGLISANSASVDESGQVYLKGAQSVTLDAGSVISADNGAGAGGNVTVLSDGTTEFNGTITARGVVQGGFVETSGEHVTIGDTARVDTRAANGNNGTWLIDPADFIIASSGGNISGATLSAMLATTNASFQSSGGVNASGNGDIIVNDNVSWSTNNLTLTAARDVQVNAVMTASGDASLTINTATANGADAAVNGGTLRMGFNPDGTFKGRIDYSSMGSLTINGDEYIVVNNFTDLQTTGENLAGFYALGSNIAGGAFTPLGDIEIPFTGKFDGLGHTISNLTIDLPGGDGVGLFGYAQNAEIRNVGLINATISGDYSTGALVGSLRLGYVTNSFATGSVTAGDFSNWVGGLVGEASFSTIENSRTDVAINVGSYVNYVGGLVGGFTSSDNTIYNSTASGSITALDNAFAVGGLVGEVQGFTSIDGNTANVSINVGDGASFVGGLVGISAGAITSSQATGNVNTGSCFFGEGGCYGGDVGGLVGLNGGLIVDSSASGNVTVGSGVTEVGGLVGFNAGEVFNSTALGAIDADVDVFSVGGLVGFNSFNGVISGSTYSGTGNTIMVGDNASAVGGLVGQNSGGIIQAIKDEGGAILKISSASGTIIAGNNASNVGGLVGYNTGMISSGNASVDINGAGNNNSLGGLVGENSGFIDGSHATGAVNVNGLASYVGGLVGLNFGEVQYSTASGNVQTDIGVAATIDLHSDDIGGLVGGNIGGSIRNSSANGNVTTGDFSDSIGGLVGGNFLGEGGGQISTSYATGDVVVGNQSYRVGGFVGENKGSIDTSYSTGSVSATGFAGVVGGFAGSNNTGAIFNSFSTGSVNVASSDSDHDFFGGFVGDNFGLIDSSYSIGYVLTPAGSTTGGFAATGGTGISNSYWNIESSGIPTSAGGDPRTTKQMMSAANFAGFDFVETWAINEGTSLPYQQALFANGVQAFSGVVAGYDPTALQKADLSVGGDAFGVGSTSLSRVSVGANGFYYHFFDRGTALIDKGTQYQVNLIGGSQLATYVGISDGLDAIDLNTATNTLVNAGVLSFSDTTFTRIVDNQGTLSLGGAVDFQNTLKNSGTLNVNTGANVALNGGGTFTGTTSVNAGGTLDVLNGTYNLSGSSAQVNGSGNINIASTGIVNVSDVSNAGTFDGVFNNAGNVTVASGAFDVNGTGTDTGTYFIAGQGSLNFLGTRDWMDGVTFLGNGSLNIEGTVNNNGTVDLFRTIGGNGTLNNNGVINVSGVDATRTYNPTFNNIGTLNLIGSTIDVYTLVLANATSNEGTIRVGEMATLSVPGGYTNNGLISGKGSIDVVGGTLINNGTISPGASPGTLTINGNLALNPSSNLLIELAGTTPGLFDVLNVNGTATLNGTVNVVQFDPNFVSVFGDVFTFLNAQGGLTGTFANVVSPSAFTVALGSSATSVNLITQQLASLTPPLTPFVDPSVFIDPSGVPNTGSLTGAGNNAGTNPSQPSTTTFNALLEGAPTAAIGGNGDGGSGEVLSELYLGEPVRGDNLDARLLCR